MGESGGQTTEFQALLDLAARGNDAARDELICKASNRLFRLTRKMFQGYSRLRRWEETDDVFQTAVMRLHRSLKNVKPDSVRGFFALATTQIRRTLIDLARHHFGPQAHGAKHHTEARGIATDDRGGALDREPERNTRPDSPEDWAEFHMAIGSLPSEEREVFEYVWYGGATQKETAGLLGISERTVLRRLHRARLSIYKMLKES